MYQIQGLTADPNQTLTIVLPATSEIVQLNLRYSDNLSSWLYDIINANLTVYNRRLVTNPNILRQWKNLITFGMACFANDGGDPMFLNDFISGRCNLLLLSSVEVQSNETLLQALRGTIQP